VSRVSTLVFRHFWATVALLGALGEWTLACWFLGIPASWIVHPLGVAGLTVVNRLAAEAFERERHSAPVLHTAGGVVLALGVIAAVGAAALGVTAASWFVATTLIAFPAEAGALEPPAGAIFAPPFALLGSLSIAAAMLVATWGYTFGYRQLRVTRLDVATRELPPALDGLRIVHLSDIHLGPTADRAALREAFDRVNALDPDLICVTGDLVDSPVVDLDHWLPELARLRARHGVYAVLGNHDRYAGADRVAAALRAATPWRLLRDEVATLEIDGDRLHLVGLEDRPGPATAVMLPSLLASVPDGDARLVLVHQPSAFTTAARLGVPLTLAGHTHGGQIAVPGLPSLNAARLMMTRFDAGTFASGRSLLHVNRGLGTSGQRVRIGAPREVTLVTLLAAGVAAAA
jgi:predicted MPP superfamily phosphohydrolase